MQVADFGLARSLLQGTDIDPINPVLTDYVATRWYRDPTRTLNLSLPHYGYTM